MITIGELNVSRGFEIGSYTTATKRTLATVEVTYNTYTPVEDIWTIQNMAGKELAVTPDTEEACPKWPYGKQVRIASVNPDVRLISAFDGSDCGSSTYEITLILAVGAS